MTPLCCKALSVPRGIAAIPQELHSPELLFWGADHMNHMPAAAERLQHTMHWLWTMASALLTLNAQAEVHALPREWQHA